MKMKKLTYIRLVLEWVKKDERDFQHISKTDKINIENKECLDMSMYISISITIFAL
jgi:hypothetical protein